MQTFYFLIKSVRERNKQKDQPGRNYEQLE